LSWFELQASELDHKNLIKSWQVGEEPHSSFLQLSFSDISSWWYLIFLGASLFLVWHFYGLAKKKGSNHASYFRVTVVLAVVLYSYSGYMVMLLWNISFMHIPQTLRKGVFGDSFGTINALCSGLAFAGVLITLLFQRKDLSETRKQIGEQNFESQFYSMLQHQQEVVKNFDIQQSKTRKIIAQGRDCFRHWDRFLGQHYRLYYGVLIVNDPHSHAYNQVYWHYRSDLSIYYRSLYSVFRLIENSNHSGAAKFGLLVRSLISDYELVMIFYNCLTPQGSKFTKYVYSFALFDNLDETLLLDQDHINFFTFEAYGSNRRLIEKLRLGPPSK
jgi:hypothetical protein